jgi:hypothetical protein
MKAAVLLLGLSGAVVTWGVVTLGAVEFVLGYLA